MAFVLEMHKKLLAFGLEMNKKYAIFGLEIKIKLLSPCFQVIVMMWRNMPVSPRNRMPSDIS